MKTLWWHKITIKNSESNAEIFQYDLEDYYSSNCLPIHLVNGTIEIPFRTIKTRIARFESNSVLSMTIAIYFRSTGDSWDVVLETNDRKIIVKKGEFEFGNIKIEIDVEN